MMSKKGSHFGANLFKLSSNTLLLALLSLFIIVKTETTSISFSNVNSSILNSNNNNNGRLLIVKQPPINNINNNNDNNFFINNAKDSFKQRSKNLTIYVKENTPIGSQITLLQPDLLDQQDQQSLQHHITNPKIIFAITGGLDHQSFTLKVDELRNKAELINEVLFDYESDKKSYNIIIRATSVFQLNQWNVTIEITDENDNKPQLEDFSIVFNNYKNHFLSAPIGRVPAIDADANDQLNYRILTGNNAQLIFINETTGDIQLSPWLNSNVQTTALITIAVSDGNNFNSNNNINNNNYLNDSLASNPLINGGLIVETMSLASAGAPSTISTNDYSNNNHETIAQLTLTTNLVTEQMLQNSVRLKLDGGIDLNFNREQFLTYKYDKFLQSLTRILENPKYYKNIVLFDVESSSSLDLATPTSTLSGSMKQDQQYYIYNGGNNNNNNRNSPYQLQTPAISINNNSQQQQQQQPQQVIVTLSFSVRSLDSQDAESYLSSHYLEQKIYINRIHLMNELGLNILPFQDNLCLHEPCKNYQECQAIQKFDEAPKTLIKTRNMIFRPIKTTQSFACTCPPTYTGMKHKTECNLQVNDCFSNPCLNGGICHRNEITGFTCQCKAEYLGPKCEHSFANSTCQSVSSSNLLSRASLLSQSGTTINSEQASFLSSSERSITQAASSYNNICGGKSKCVNLNRNKQLLAAQRTNNNNNNNLASLPLTTPTSALVGGGFICQDCPYPQWSNELCKLKTRSFTKNSYITLPSLKRRHRFNIQLQFSTIQTDALIFYNGRYNDKHDFIALEIVDGFLKFSYSLGAPSNINCVSLSSISVSDGNWHKVTVDYKDRNVTLLLDDCDPILDEALARYSSSLSSSSSSSSSLEAIPLKRCSNSTTYNQQQQQLDIFMSTTSTTGRGSAATAGLTNNDFRMLDLNSPMQFGSLAPMPIFESPFLQQQDYQQQFYSTNRFLKTNSFIGCMSDIYIDYNLIDLYNPIQEVGTQIGCPEKRGACQQQASNCNGFQCQDFYGSSKCLCGDDYLGKSCDILISNEKVRRFFGNSYLTFSPIENSIISTQTNWIISMHFRTLNPNGLLMKISLEPEAIIQLELFNGGIKLSYNRYQNLTLNKIMLDDGEWHFIEMIWSQDYVQLELDYNPNLSIQSGDFSQANGGPQVFGSTIRMITIGASPMISKQQSSSSINSAISPAAAALTSSSSSSSSLDNINNVATSGVSVTSGSTATSGTQSSGISDNQSASSNSLPISDDYYFSNTAMGTNNSSIGLLASSSSSSSSSPSFVGCIYGVNISDNNEMWLSLAEERNVERGCQVVDICEQVNICPPNSRCVRKGLNQRKCICNQGFVGERCLPVCDLNPCFGENSKCITTNGNNDQQRNNQQIVQNNFNNFNEQQQSQLASQSYRCECEPLRSGKNCEHQLNPRCPSNWWASKSNQSNGGGGGGGGGDLLTNTSANNNNNNNLCGPCNCDESKGFDGDCDKLTGKCYCKLNHYQPANSDYCLPCDCYLIGSSMTSCNQTTGQCKCRQGVVGRRCDTCISVHAEVTLRGCEVVYNDCPKSFSDGIWWDKTKLGQIAYQQCPPTTSTGTAERYCHKTEGWQKAKMFNCLSNSFTDLFTQYKFLEDNNVPLTIGLAVKIASNLRRALNETIQQSLYNELESDSNSATYNTINNQQQEQEQREATLYGSDMYISFRLIHHLIQHESRQFGLNLTHKQDSSYVRNLAESISYLLDPMFAHNWPEISARSPNGGAEYLLKLIDNYGKILIESHADTNTQPFEIKTKYLTFGLDSLAPDQLYELSANDKLQPMINLNAYDSTNTNGILLASNFDAQTMADFKIMKQQQKTLVVYSIWKSLSQLMPSFYDGTVQHSLGVLPKSNSPIVWLTMRSSNGSEFLYKNIQPKISYTLRMVETVGKSRPQCAIWDFFGQSSLQSTNSLAHHHKLHNQYSLGATGSGALNQQQQQTNNQTQQKQDLKSIYGIKKTGEFSTKGCEITGISSANDRFRFKYEYVNCSCDRLGAVTVLMDSTANFDYLGYYGDGFNDSTNNKDLILICSIIISLVILASALFILSCIRGHSIKSNSNTINKNLIFLLITIELLILYNIISRSKLNQLVYQCKLVAIFLQYFSISLFFWLLVNAIHFYRMLTELKDINHGPMKFYHIIGYAIPAFLVSIAVGLRIEQFGNYFCWISVHEPIIWTMFAPISFTTIITILLIILALSKSYPVVVNSNGNSNGNNINNINGAESNMNINDKFVIGNEDYLNLGLNQLNNVDLLKNHMFINIMKTPLIGIYWLILVYVVNDSLIDYIYLLPIVTILKSIILIILFCFVDKHIRYNIYVSWLRFRGKKIPLIMNNNGHYQHQNYSTGEYNIAGHQQHWSTMLGSSNNHLTSSDYINNPYCGPMGTGPGATSTTPLGYHQNGGLLLSPQTPGFQGSCTDIFRPDVLAYSAAASTTSRSTATGTSSSAYNQYHSNRIVKDTTGAYGKSGAGRSKSQHRSRSRHHKKSSHHKHHHHKHHHHHHHHSHRSHRHQERSYNESESNYELDNNSTQQYHHNHNHYNHNNNEKINHSKTATTAKNLSIDEQQTVPMELSAKTIQQKEQRTSNYDLNSQLTTKTGSNAQHQDEDNEQLLNKESKEDTSSNGSNNNNNNINNDDDDNNDNQNLENKKSDS